MIYLAVDDQMKPLETSGLYRAVNDNGDLLSLVRDQVGRQCEAVRLYDFSEDEGSPVKINFPGGKGAVASAMAGTFDARALWVDASGQDRREMSLPRAIARAGNSRDGSEVWNLKRTERWNWGTATFEPSAGLS